MCVHIAIPEPTGKDTAYNQRSFASIPSCASRCRGHVRHRSAARAARPRGTPACRGAGNPPPREAALTWTRKDMAKIQSPSAGRRIRTAPQLMSFCCRTPSTYIADSWYLPWCPNRECVAQRYPRSRSADCSESSSWPRGGKRSPPVRIAPGSKLADLVPQGSSHEPQVEFEPSSGHPRPRRQSAGQCDFAPGTARSRQLNWIRRITLSSVCNGTLSEPTRRAPFRAPYLPGSFRRPQYGSLGALKNRSKRRERRMSADSVSAGSRLNALLAAAGLETA